VGYLGRAEPVKGLNDLVHAVLALPASAPVRLRAVVVASGPDERRELAGLKRAARRDPRVIFEPPRPPRDVPRWLASIDTLCCPSRVVEGGPTPVIGSNLPALAEIVEPQVTGMLVPAGDRRALTALLVSLAADPERLDAWRRRLPRPRQFDAVTADYLAEYQA
jgi:glycosyltransferase involved in cell wall biosynthesis